MLTRVLLDQAEINCFIKAGIKKKQLKDDLGKLGSTDVTLACDGVTEILDNGNTVIILRRNTRKRRCCWIRLYWCWRVIEMPKYVELWIRSVSMECFKMMDQMNGSDEWIR